MNILIPSHNFEIEANAIKGVEISANKTKVAIFTKDGGRLDFSYDDPATGLESFQRIVLDYNKILLGKALPQ